MLSVRDELHAICMQYRQNRSPSTSWPVWSLRVCVCRMFSLWVTSWSTQLPVIGHQYQKRLMQSGNHWFSLYTRRLLSYLQSIFLLCLQHNSIHVIIPCISLESQLSFSISSFLLLHSCCQFKVSYVTWNYDIIIKDFNWSEQKVRSF